MDRRGKATAGRKARRPRAGSRRAPSEPLSYDAGGEVPFDRPSEDNVKRRSASTRSETLEPRGGLPPAGGEKAAAAMSAGGAPATAVVLKKTGRLGSFEKSVSTGLAVAIAEMQRLASPDGIGLASKGSGDDGGGGVDHGGKEDGDKRSTSRSAGRQEIEEGGGSRGPGRTGLSNTDRRNVPDLSRFSGKPFSNVGSATRALPSKNPPPEAGAVSNPKITASSIRSLGLDTGVTTAEAAAAVAAEAAEAAEAAAAAAEEAAEVLMMTVESDMSAAAAAAAVSGTGLPISPSTVTGGGGGGDGDVSPSSYRSASLSSLRRRSTSGVTSSGPTFSITAGGVSKGPPAPPSPTSSQASSLATSMRIKSRRHRRREASGKGTRPERESYAGGYVLARSRSFGSEDMSTPRHFHQRRSSSSSSFRRRRSSPPSVSSPLSVGSGVRTSGSRRTPRRHRGGGGSGTDGTTRSGRDPKPVGGTGGKGEHETNSNGVDAAVADEEIPSEEEEPRSHQRGSMSMGRMSSGEDDGIETHYVNPMNVRLMRVLPERWTGLGRGTGTGDGSSKQQLRRIFFLPFFFC